MIPRLRKKSIRALKKFAACATWFAVLALARLACAQGVQVGDEDPPQRRRPVYGWVRRRLRQRHPIEPRIAVRRQRNDEWLLLQPELPQLQHHSLLQPVEGRLRLPVADQRQRRGGHGEFLHRKPLSRLGQLPLRLQQHRDVRTGRSYRISPPRATGQGFGVNWSALFPGWPTLSVGYQQGSGSGTLYGTNQESSSSQHLFNRAFFVSACRLQPERVLRPRHLELRLPGVPDGRRRTDINNSSGQDFGMGASRYLPWWNGQFYGSYNHSSYSTRPTRRHGAELDQLGLHGRYRDRGREIPSHSKARRCTSTRTSPTTSRLTSTGTWSTMAPSCPRSPILGRTPTRIQWAAAPTISSPTISPATPRPPITTSTTMARTTPEHFISGNVNYGRKLFDMFTFSAGIVESSSDLGNNNIGFVGTVNYYRKFGQWQTSGSFSYAQNVQSLLDYGDYVLLQLQRQPSPPVQLAGAVDAGFQRQPYRSVQPKELDKQQRGLLHQPESSSTGADCQLYYGDRKFAADQRGNCAACRRFPVKRLPT